jgi:hypothetical protein
MSRIFYSEDDDFVKAPPGSADKTGRCAHPAKAGTLRVDNRKWRIALPYIPVFAAKS